MTNRDTQGPKSPASNDKQGPKVPNAENPCIPLQGVGPFMVDFGFRIFQPSLAAFFQEIKLI